MAKQHVRVNVPDFSTEEQARILAAVAVGITNAGGDVQEVGPELPMAVLKFCRKAKMHWFLVEHMLAGRLLVNPRDSTDPEDWEFAKPGTESRELMKEAIEETLARLENRQEGG